MSKRVTFKTKRKLETKQRLLEIDSIVVSCVWNARAHPIKAVVIKSTFRHAKRETLSFDLDFFPFVLIVHGSMSERNGSVMIQVYWITALANQQLSVDHSVRFAFYVSLFLFPFCLFFFSFVYLFFFFYLFFFTSSRGTKIFFLIILATVAFYTMMMIMTLLVVVVINNHNNQ